MGNQHFNKQVTPSRSGKASTDMGGGKAPKDVPYGSTKWPGAGGPAQGARNMGVPKLKNAHVRSEGI
jgi:hypothetical protein